MQRSAFAIARAVGLPSPALFDNLEPRMLLTASGFELVADAPGFAGQTVTADFDGDADQDVATISATPTFVRLDIYSNDGRGELSQLQHFNFPVADGLPMTLAVGDFDADGDSDVLAFGFRLFRNTGGVFSAAEVLNATLIDGAHFLADHNGDGLLDVFVQDSLSGDVTLHLNAGGTSVGNGQVLPSPAGPDLIAVTDMDADGDADMVFAGADAVVYLNNAGTFAAGPTFSAGFTTAPVVADFNGDNLPDLVWTDDRLLSARGTGGGSFAAAVTSGAVGWVSASAVADFNADGLLDVLGIRGDVTNRVVAVSMAADTGVFEDAVREAYSYQTAAELDPLIFAAEMTGGSRADLLLVRRFGITPLAGFMTVYRSAIGGPEVTSFTGPEGAFVAGRQLPFTITTETGEGGDVDLVQIFRDANNNDEFDDGDELVGTAVAGAEPGSWTFSQIAPDSDAGEARYFAVATDVADVASSAAEFDVLFWTRVSYPEGWRNDATINEYVPMVNPNAFPVEYRLIAHYETGERDVVIAEGVIPAFSRGGVTVSEHANPDGAIVRLNEGYALELQSSAFLGAMLSHYDSFTESGEGTATGESFTGITSTDWYFADASTFDASFLVFFNPSDVNVTMTITFYGDQGETISLPWGIEALRRSGLAMLEPLVGLTPGARYGVLVTASSPILAALSSYSTSDGAGFSALGRPVDPAGTTDFPLVEFGDTTENRLTLFNSNPGAASSVTVEISYPGTGAAPTVQTLNIGALGRMVIDLNASRPAGAAAATVHVESTDVRAHVESIDATRGDSTATGPAAEAFDTWAFADGFLDSNTAGTVGFETLAVYNPSDIATDVRVRFLFTDGTFVDQVSNIGAGSTLRLQLDQVDAILDHAQLNFYSIVVNSQSRRVVASMIHWDLFQGGGWATLGTPANTLQLG